MVSPQTTKTTRRGWRLVGVGITILLGLSVVGWFVYRSRTNGPAVTSSPTLEAASEAMRSARYDEALQRFSLALEQGESLTVSHRFDCAQAAMHVGRLRFAEEQLRELLRVQPRHREANELLCALLRISGRNWELRPFAWQLMRQEAYSQANLIALQDNGLAVEQGSQEETAIERFLVQNGRRQNDPLARLSQARYLLDHNQVDQALPLLHSVVEEVPTLLEAQARLGHVLLLRERQDEFLSWWRALPEQASDHPELWQVRGKWAESQGNPAGAARCYWEVLRRHPDHAQATYRLAQLLLALGKTAEAEPFSTRAKELAELKTFSLEVRARPERCRELSQQLEKLGRRWEALGWAYVAIERTPTSPLPGQGASDSRQANTSGWAFAVAERLTPALRSVAELLPPQQNLASQVDLAQLPLPTEQPAPSLPLPTPQDVPARTTSLIAFDDTAAAAGITFSFFNGADPLRAYMFEFSGGGLAVIDYDADGWPDLYLTQGCTWPPDANQRTHLDRLFRNLGDGRFVDVTQEAGLISPGYGQGVAAGDFDSDGWPDLYIANIGRNQLYRNNGDGTFTDVTESSGIQGTEWTISVLIADLNGDTHPELYNCNYLGGPRVFTEVCYSAGKPIQCFPPQFPGELDRVSLNQGDGTFLDVSQSAGVRLPDGKGMGIVAADLDGSRRLSLFITNDTTPNFLLLNQTATPGAALRFEEQGLLRGVALSDAGKASSCMGIAAGDPNQDGRLDLFVTNFQDEPNNLFVQGEGLLFEDRIREARLYDPGFDKEGWGAQFLDADNDGDDDLVVANGHLDDYPHSVGVTRMPTQVFENVGAGRFVALPAERLGRYFQSLYLGRAVARLDHNRDGRPDFGITHLHAPFGLLTNRSAAPDRHFVTIHLRGVSSSRDAIGAKVSVRTAGGTQSRQLIAGDGFQASNQRVLFFGLGNHSSIEQIQVDWPSGQSQVSGPVSADQELIWVEGTPQPRVFSRVTEPL